MQKVLAYSLLETKGVNEDLRELTGIATTPEPDRAGDIVEPLGAKFAAEIPFLWQHHHDMPIGTVRLSAPTKAGIKFVAKVAKIDEPGPLKDMVDMAWQAIKAGLVKGTSIGFRSLAHDYMSEGGVRFREYEIIELSAVTVPANAGASIQSIKAWGAPREAGRPVRIISAPPTAAVDLKGAVRLVRP